MEAGEIGFDYNTENANANGTSNMFPNHPPMSSDSPRLEPVPPSSSPARKRKAKDNNRSVGEKDTAPSVSSCYMFKSRLQEYCQKAGLMTPVYETVKSGPSHEPSFRSTVVVNDTRYDSLDGFFNRKAAEQSAAEIALMEMGNTDDTKFGISQPVQETGLCKNLLQEYALKMNYAIPLYECKKEEKQGRMPTYTCAVEIGPIKYIGASADTKKEAEIKAARTALLAIRLGGPTSDEPMGNSSIYTVVPQKKKAPDVGVSSEDKPKKDFNGKKRRMNKPRRRYKRDNDSDRGTKDSRDGFGQSTMNACSSRIRNEGS